MTKRYICFMSISVLACFNVTLFAANSLLQVAQENKKKATLNALQSPKCSQKEKNLALLAASKRPNPPHTTEKDRLAIINTLLNHGAEIDYVSVRKETGLAGGSPLFFATEESYDQRVQLLLERGADPNWIDHRGYTPLIRACINGNISITIALCVYGADIHTQSKTGSSALSFSAMRKHSELTNELLLRGACLSTAKTINMYAKKLIKQKENRAIEQRLLCLKETLQTADRLYDHLMRLFLSFDGTEHLWNIYKQLP